MFKNSDSKIGVRETTALIIIIIFTKLTDNTITNYFKAGENAGWMIPFFSALTMLLPIGCILSLVKRYENKGLIEIIYNLMWKYIGFIIGYWLLTLNLIIIIIIIIINLRENCDTITTLFFPRTSIDIIIFSLIGTGCVIANLGLKACARTSWLMLMYIEVSMVILIIIASQLMEVYFIFPIAGSGMGKVIGTGVTSASIFQGIILLSVCYPMFRNYKTFKTANLIGLLISAFQLICTCLIIVMAFDYPAVSIISVPLFTLMRLVNITRFISNLEALLLLPSSIAQLLYFSTYLYLFTAIFTYTLKLKKVEPLILPISALVVMLSLIPENSIKFSATLGKTVTLILTITIIILPLILLAISQLKGDYKKC